MRRSIYRWIMAALLLSGCAAAPVVIEQKDAAPPVVRKAEEPPAQAAAPAPVQPPRFFEDRELLLDGVRLLSLPDQTQQEKARPVFISLIQLYPQSRWRPAAEAFLRLIDDREAFREANRQDHLLVDRVSAEKAKAQQDNEALRKTLRELSDKLKTETTALAQENEQLKQDIQRLKALEIELEKRERKLR